MSKRYPYGFISTFYNPLKNPNAPTIGAATGDDASASVPFTAPADVGGSAITEYNARSTPGDVTASAAASPISVTGLTNGTSYTFKVWAINTYGAGLLSAASNSITPAPFLAIFGGGAISGGGNSNITTVHQVNINTLGNSTSFGNLNNEVRNLGALGNSSRAVFFGGHTTTDTTAAINVIEFLSMTSGGSATDFGDMSDRGGFGSGTANSTRGIFNVGDRGAGLTNAINYITIASTGNASTFGELSLRRSQNNWVASSTRAVSSGGGSVGSDNTIDYVTIATTGNAIDFGDMYVTINSQMAHGSVCSSTRGIFSGGYATGVETNVIQYITIATAGNTTDFGDLTATRVRQSSASSTVRGLFAAGVSSTVKNNIDYVTIATTGNAADFGDMSFNCDQANGCSNCHGGL